MNRHTKAQMSIDFLIGIVIFIGALLFVFQFMSGTVLPFTQGANEKTVTVDRVSDSLYYDKMGTDEKGVIELSYLYNEEESRLKTENEILRDLNIDEDRHRLNITVVSEDGVEKTGDEVVQINELGLSQEAAIIGLDPENARIGPDPSLSGSSVNKATRVGYVRQTAGNKEPETVVVNIRMW